MNVLSNVITYMRRYLKTPSNAVLTDNLLIDYVNRFWTVDVSARIELFDLKTTYQFVTQPGVDRYNMPLYSIQTEPLGPISFYPVYQGFKGPCFVDGIETQFCTEKDSFNSIWPNYVQDLFQSTTGNGTNGPYTIPLPFTSNFATSINYPYVSGVIRGHVDMSGIISTGINQDPPIVRSEANFISQIPTTSVFPAIYITSTDATGANVVVTDSGQFLNGAVNYGLLMSPGPAPYGNTPLIGATNVPTTNYSTTQNTVNYVTGIINNLYFPTSIPSGMPISAQCVFYELGIPRSILFYNNTLTLRAPPNTQYVITLEAYLTPAAFFSTSQAIPFSYMSEYIALGAARKAMYETSDWELFRSYEPIFKEQENLVHIRSQRQFTSTRTQTIYSQGANRGYGNTNLGVGVT